jgi:hypothetical protein
VQRIASAGVLLVALALSLLAIGKLNTEPDAGSTTSSDDVVSIAANSDPAPVADYPIVGQEALVRVFGQVAVQTTGTLSAAVNVPPAIDSRHTRPPSTTTTTRRHHPTTTVPPTTTTTRRPPPSTTTTIFPTTTTRGPGPTTTTGAPATTTTVGTLPTPSGEFFTTLLRGSADAGGGEIWWDADYFRNLPYSPSTGWTDGDRAGYRCFYSFLLLDNQVVGRVTFTRVEEAASYAMVNDRYMEEGIRFYDGTLAPANGPRELGECPDPTQAYSPSNGSDQRPTITYSTTGGALLEVRNYKKTVALNGITFQQVESTDQRVTVVAYKDNLPAIVIYYESMVPGVVMNSDLG